MNKKLIELNSSSFQYVTTVFDEFESICKPLYDFGIPNFVYIKLFNDGSYFRLSNKQEEHELYFGSVANQGSYWTNALEYKITPP